MSRAWTAFGLALACYLLGLFHRVAPAAIAQDLSAAFDTTAAALGALSAAYFWVYTAMQLPTGVLADTLGPRRLLSGGGLIAGAGVLAFGLASNLAVAAAGRMLVGLGFSVAFVAALKLIANWFEPRRFATLTGVVVFAGNLASAAAGAPFAWVLKWATWREVMVAMGVLSIAVAAASWWIVADGPAGRGAAAASREPWYRGMGAVLRNPATWPPFFANVGLGGSFFAFVGLWGVPYLVEAHGLTRTDAAAHVTIMLTAFAVGGLFAGALSDRLGRRKPIFVGGALVYVLGWAILLAAPPMTSGLRYALIAVMGLAAAGFTMSWACAKEVNRIEFSGISTALANVGIFLGPAFMQPLVGVVVDASMQGVPLEARGLDTWWGPLAIIALAAGIGFACSLAVRETYCRQTHGPT